MSAGVEAASRRPGRPRRLGAQRAIVDAAGALLKEVGFAALTTDAIARRAGVSKATIYRWWSGKGAVVMEGLLASAESQLAFPDTGSTAEDLRLQMHGVLAFFRGEAGPTVAALVGGGQLDPSLLRDFRDHYLEPRREAAKSVLSRGIARGELCPDLDAEAVLDALYGPLYYRLLIGHGQLEPAFADALIGFVLPRLKAGHLVAPPASVPLTTGVSPSGEVSDAPSVTAP